MDKLITTKTACMKKITLLLCFLACLSILYAQQKTGMFDGNEDVGNPAKKIKEVSDEMIAWKTDGTKLYQALPIEMKIHWQQSEALREVPKERPGQESSYDIWNEYKKNV